jgi:carbonic anhydrase
LVHCVDPRIQEGVEWLRIAYGLRFGEFDRIAVAGGGGFPDRFERELDISVRRHGVREIILTGHEDCLAGTTVDSLLSAAETLLLCFDGQVNVRAIWLNLDGTREELATP